MSDDIEEADSPRYDEARRPLPGGRGVRDAPSTKGLRSSGIPPNLLFEQALEQTRMGICLTDPAAEDDPIIFANSAFEALTGYQQEEIVGQNCRFLQCDETDPAEVRRLREAIAAREVCVVELLNVRKDGTRFWNALHVGPIYDEDGSIRLYYGSQWDISDLLEERGRRVQQAAVARELQHRIGNLFGVVNSIVRLSGQEAESAAEVVQLATERLDALARAHAATVQDDLATGPTELRPLVETVLEPYRSTAKERIVLEGAALRVSPQLVTPIGLALHELATNAVKYGALSEAGGTVTLRWSNAPSRSRLNIVWTEQRGPRVDQSAAVAGTGTGRRMVDGILRVLGGGIAYDWRAEGLVARLDMPLVAEA